MSLIADLKQRKLVQWALAYAAGTWVALQAIGMVASSYGWSPVVMRAALGIAVIGFLATLVLAWYHGERGQQKTSSTELLILAVLLAVGGGVIWNSERGATASDKAAPTAAPANVAIAKTAINPRSIAVLPFANLSADKDNAYFAEGIQDEILTRLSKIAELKVISRTSTMRYASSPDNLPEIARTLGVATILEGSVEKVGNAVRINVQLIKADTDTHLWAEIYDRKLLDIFAIQSEVTTAIAKSLQATLTANEQRDLGAKPTSNTEAYEAYLRGIAAERSSEYSAESSAKARDAYQEAVRLDPDFAEAWHRLTQVLSLRYSNEPKTPAALAALKQAADTTARLQPGSVNAQLAQAYYRYRGLRDYPGALEAFSRVTERAPNNVDALLSLAYVERRLGDLDGALVQLAKAEALDPANPVLLSAQGEFLSAVRRYPEALAAFGKVQKLIPGNASVIFRTADAYQAQGNLAVAEAVLEHGPRGDPMTEAARVEQAWLRNQPDRLAEACRQLGAYVDAHHDRWELAKLDCDLRVAYLQHLQGKQADAMSACRSVLGALVKAGFPDSDSGILRGTANACLGNKVAALSDFAHVEALFNRDAMAAALIELSLARAQMWLGDNDAAIALLTHSLTVPYGTAVGFLRLDPFWQPLRNDPRFKALLAGR